MFSLRVPVSCDRNSYYNPSIKREELLVYEEPKRLKPVNVNANT